MKVEEINVKDIGYIENIRQKLDNVDLADLMQSIKQEGLMQPIGLVKRKATGLMNRSNQLIIIWGNRRLAAFKKLNYKTIPAVILEDDDMTEDDFIVKNTVENVQRQEISVLELGRVCSHLRKKMSVSEIAVKLAISINKVQGALNSYKTMPKQIQEKVKMFSSSNPQTHGRKGKLPFTIANKIASLRDISQANKIKIFEYARREELELGQIFVIARLVEGGKPLSEAFEESKNWKNVGIKVLMKIETHKEICDAHGYVSKYLRGLIEKDYPNGTIHNTW